MKAYALVLLLVPGLLISCSRTSGEQFCVKAGVPYKTVIAHRGASYYAPEETAPAYLLARDWGADYLELDLQRTKDGVLIALHDNNLRRTTNVEDVFPDRADMPVSTFTLAELKRLDAGSWFNEAYPDRARPAYKGLKILTLDEIIDIAEGRDKTTIKENSEKLSQNYPGLYIETKVPALFPGIEKDLFKKLSARGWVGSNKTAPEGFDAGKNVGVAFTSGRIVLQTFEKTSLPLLKTYMPEVPTCFLLWLDDGAMVSKDPEAKPAAGQSMADFYASQEVKSEEEYELWLDFALDNGADCIGPATILKARGDQSYFDLAQPWMLKMAHEKGLFVHAYTVDEPEDFETYDDRGVDGFFTNRTDRLLEYYGRKPALTLDAILSRYGY